MTFTCTCGKVLTFEEVESLYVPNLGGWVRPAISFWPIATQYQCAECKAKRLGHAK